MHLIKAIFKNIENPAGDIEQRKNYERIIKYNISLFYRNGKFALDYPKHIQFDTISKCNMSCSFCPASKKNDIRKTEIININLFKKIIDEFIDTDENRVIDFSTNNEPLLDERICDLIEYTRSQLKNKRNIKLNMFTNGTLLTENIFLKLSYLLDCLQIDNYSDKLKFIKPVENIYNKFKNHFFNAEIIIAIRKANEILINRAGISPNYKNINYDLIDSLCLLPFGQMVIRPDGKVSLCCADVYGQYTMGDLNNDSIKNIWNNENYNNFRHHMRLGRNNIDLLCSKCNAMYLSF